MLHRWHMKMIFRISFMPLLQVFNTECELVQDFFKFFFNSGKFLKAREEILEQIDCKVFAYSLK